MCCAQFPLTPLISEPLQSINLVHSHNLYTAMPLTKFPVSTVLPDQIQTWVCFLSSQSNSIGQSLFFSSVKVFPMLSVQSQLQFQPLSLPAAQLELSSNSLCPHLNLAYLKVACLFLSPNLFLVSEALNCVYPHVTLVNDTGTASLEVTRAPF